ncbi:MAG: hypothetical protein RIR73_1831 [Chloroflexota bacterium]|jgi:hypothetical protein
MNDLEKIIMEEISSLEEMRLVDVIGFIRYLKAEKPVRQEWITTWYETALEAIHDKENERDLTSENTERQRSQ